MPTLQFSDGPEPWKNPPYRKQLLNHIVDGKAQVRPESVWAKVPRDTSSYDAGYRKITYKLFANAINGIASWIIRELGRSTTFETLAYFGDWDPRYIIMILGAVKAGYKLVTPSPTYPTRGLIALLDSLDCKAILTASMKFPVITQSQELENRPTHQISSLNELLETVYEHVPFNKTFEQAESEPLVVVHTSGTTGIPKPLILTHGWAACWIEHNQLNPPPGNTSVEQLLHGVELCSVTPPFHCSGFFPNFWGAIPNDIVVVYPLPGATFALETAVAMIRHNDPSVLIAPPHILVALANDAELVREFSSKLSLIGFGGGPLPGQAGSILTEHFQVVSVYGTSEMGLVSKIASAGPWERDSWKGFKVHPRDNMQFRPLQGDLYEAFIVRNEAADQTQAVFKLYPELTEWSTKDIFSPDPHHKGNWIYQSRIDDVIILSNGGTLNPLGFEQQLMKAPFVSQALLGGSGKSCTALLVELYKPPPFVMDLLWEMVEECNSNFPPQVTVSRSHIIVVESDRPLPKAAKGNVQRAAALRLYGKEIDALYSP